MLEGFYFKSNRLLSRSLESKDAHLLLQYYSDREAMKYRGSAPLSNLADAQSMVAKAVLDSMTEMKLRLAICRVEDGILVGTLLLSMDKLTPQACEIGFSFGREHWGLGYAEETLMAVEKALNDGHKIVKVEAWCKKANIASNRVFEKLGYRIVDQNSYPESNHFVKNIGLK